MSAPREPLKGTEVDLLATVASELIPALRADGSLREVRELAFLHWDKARNEEVQVHVAVTRDPDEFLEPFQTLEIT